MKVKHWIVYQLCFFIIFIYGCWDTIIYHKTLSTGILPVLLMAFIFGTLGTAVAFIWAELENPI